MKLDKSK